jgi:Dyp-type peroxidase family
MTADKNKLMVRRFVEEIFNCRNLAVIDEMATTEVAAQLKQTLAECHPLFIALPDFQFSVDETGTDGDLVVCHNSWRGTHTGRLHGFPPTGQKMSGTETDIFRVIDGHIVECWQKWGSIGLLPQLKIRQLSSAHQPHYKVYQEPVLDIQDIQGHVLGGFDKDYQTFLFLGIADAQRARDWLRQTLSRITTLEEVLAEEGRLKSGGALPDPSPSRPVWQSIAFTFQGLKKLGLEAEQFIDVPFKAGMHNHSKLLGDPIEKEADGCCRNWVVGGPHNVPDILLIGACNEKETLADEVARIESSLEPGLSVIFKQEGAVLPPPSTCHEHFGFLDNVSQPGVRGRLSEEPTDYLTLRQNPANPQQGKPGQNLIWPGEFIFGYSGQDAMDKIRPGTIANGGPSWAHNGSFLVFRRLRQDVEAFNGFLRVAAEELAQSCPELSGLTFEKLAAKLMGRWFSGAPIMRAPDADNPSLAQDDCERNNFGFLHTVPESHDAHNGNGHNGKREGHQLQKSSGDLLGLICPQAAHIRKVYPRDHPTSEISEANVEMHRLIRRGIPYGAPYPAPEERGLLFLAYQTSIERQFEFITRAWLNNPHLRDGDDGYDPIVGQNSSKGQNRVRAFYLSLPNPDGSVVKKRIELPRDWVVPTGGAYFFTPSISALKEFCR